jgi:hypothetical protein
VRPGVLDRPPQLARHHHGNCGKAYADHVGMVHHLRGAGPARNHSENQGGDGQISLKMSSNTSLWQQTLVS